MPTVFKLNLLATRQTHVFCVPLTWTRGTDNETQYIWLATREALSEVEEESIKSRFSDWNKQLAVRDHVVFREGELSILERTHFLSRTASVICIRETNHTTQTVAKHLSDTRQIVILIRLAFSTIIPFCQNCQSVVCTSALRTLPYWTSSLRVYVFWLFPADPYSLSVYISLRIPRNGTKQCSTYHNKFQHCQKDYTGFLYANEYRLSPPPRYT